MKKKGIRYISLVISFLLMLSLLSGCAGGREEIKVAARTDIIQYFDNNGLTEYFENKTNTKISWIDYGSEDIFDRVKEDIDKEQADLPDAYLGLGLFEDQMRVVADQLFMDLTNIVDSDTTEFKKVIAEDNSRKSDMYIDGRIYSYPSFYENYAHEFPQKMWINTKWLEQVQAEAPTDTDELVEVLRLFRDNDPNGNGEADEIPFGVAYKGGNYNSLGFIINSFIPTDYDLSDSKNYLNVDESGTVYASIVDPKFKDALKYIKQLVDEGLMNEDIFNASPNALNEGNAEEEVYGIIAAADIHDVISDMERVINYEPLPPLGGEDAVSASRLTKVQTGGYMLAINTEHKEAALKFGDALLESSGTLSILYGVEGTGWDKADTRIGALGGETTTWKLLDKDKAGEVPFAELKGAIPYWYPASLQMAQQATPEEDGQVDLKTDENWTGYINKITSEIYELPGRKYSKYILPEIVFTAEQEQTLSEKGNVRAEIHDYLTKTCHEFITGEKDIEENWNKYIDDLNEKGLQTLIDMMQQAYNEYKTL